MKVSVMVTPRDKESWLEALNSDTNYANAMIVW